MYEEQFLAEKLQQFSLLDIALFKIVYFLVGLLVATNYIVLTSVSWIFYLLMFLIAVFPIVIHLFSFEGSYIQKARKYLKTNKPSYQVLLFFSMFFFACTLAVLIPALSLVPWYVYLILIIIFAIKPMRSNMFW
ncbi:hypothetical protein FM755_09045 [Francisella tularensis]|uniref:Membrane protein n=2 Tax=Francisella tularensis subsp. holarctica TaxID=119857 RepID=A0AAI8FTD2_FRATH|nr:hypothetical protein [Francisella tularensis]AFX70271.1 hypothetical protein F92_03110 [Francisella tularensis subsp. holarctica F92]ABI82539.1 conserved hypothetical protein [Francisella tularensis subsp. holarctica OSU18]ABU61080.1 hypothetical membrane protein [Francisella tularensis subsp. holarctica FTNF002-00]AFT92474.1 hypothetical protein FTS_0569 [Francisella tularensis subsp. holarctica FSC200]AJI52191.1 putative membrane protein [Francisella tularensis subsp. holarctica]